MAGSNATSKLSGCRESGPMNRPVTVTMATTRSASLTRITVSIAFAARDLRARWLLPSSISALLFNEIRR